MHLKEIESILVVFFIIITLYSDSTQFSEEMVAPKNNLNICFQKCSITALIMSSLSLNLSSHSLKRYKHIFSVN